MSKPSEGMRDYAKRMGGTLVSGKIRVKLTPEMVKAMKPREGAYLDMMNSSLRDTMAWRELYHTIRNGLEPNKVRAEWMADYLFEQGFRRVEFHE